MRWKKRTVVLVVLLLLIGNAVLLVRAYVTPERLRSLAEAEMRKVLPGATIGSAIIERYSGQVRFNDIVIPRASGEPLVTIGSVRASVAPLSMLSGRPVVNRIEVEAVRIDGAIELSKLLPTKPGGKKLAVRQAVLRNCEVTIEAGVGYPEFPRTQVTNIDVDANASSPTAGTYHVELTAREQYVGTIRATADVDIEAKTARGSVTTPDVKFTQELRACLPAITQKIWGNFDPTGAMSWQTRWEATWAKPEKPRFFCVGEARDCSIQFRWFPLRVHDIEGTIEYDGTTCWMRDLRARRGTGVVRLPHGISTEKAKDVDVEIVADDIALDDEVKQACPPVVRKLWETCQLTAGTVDVDYRFVEKPRWPEPFQSATVRFDGAEVRHKAFPLPLQQVSGSIKWTTDHGSTLDLLGRCGLGIITVRGNIPNTGPVTEPNLTIQADQLSFDDTLFSALPPGMRKMCELFSPEGLLNATATLTADPSSREMPPMRLLVQPQGSSLTCKFFPLKVSNLVGRLWWDSDKLDIITLTGQAGTADVAASGSILLKQPPAGPNLRIELRNLALTPAVRSALPPDTQATWDSFNPEGVVDAVANITVDPTKEGAPKHTLELRPRRCNVLYKPFPYPLTDLMGHVTFEGDRVKIEGVRGRAGQGDIEINGVVTTTKGGSAAELDIEFQRVVLDDKLRSALPEAWQKTWEAWKLSGVADGLLKLRVETRDGKPVVAIAAGSSIDIKKAAARYQLFPYPLTEIAGHIALEGDQWRFEGLRGRAGQGDVTINGTWTTRGGDSSAQLELDLQRVTLDEKLRGPLPAAWQQVWDAWKPSGFADGSLKLRIEASQGEGAFAIDPGSSVDLKKLTALGRNLPDISADVTYGDGRLALENLSGMVYGGRVSGGIEVITAGEVTYFGSIALYGVDLKMMFESLKIAQGEVRGILSGDATFFGAGAGPDNIEAEGRFLAERGNLGHVPAVYQLLTVLSLNWPAGTVINDADVDMRLEKSTIHVRALNMRGTGLPVHGTGTVSLDGKLDLNFITGRSGPESLLNNIPLVNILYRQVDKMMPEIKKYIIEIKVTGTFAKPEAKLVPLPGVAITAPIRAFLGLLLPKEGKKE